MVHHCADSHDDNLGGPLNLLHSLHAKLGKLFRHISEEELKKEFIHPEYGKRISIDETIGMYAWYSNHHLAHIK